MKFVIFGLTISSSWDNGHSGELERPSRETAIRRKLRRLSIAKNASPKAKAPPASSVSPTVPQRS